MQCHINTICYINFLLLSYMIGILYAVKKLKAEIHTESEGNAMMREVCAHAALQGMSKLFNY
jgi:hypothetical protein